MSNQSRRGSGRTPRSILTDVRHVARTGSTNDDLAALAAAGVAEGVVLVADHQSAGRGRRDRTWQAAPGAALLASVLLRPRVADGCLGLVPLVAGVAVCDAARELGARDVALKWPNDVVVGPRKLAGVLARVVGDAVVVGFGVNVTGTPPGVTDAVALVDLVGADVGRDELLEAVLDHFEEHYRALDPAAVVAAVTVRMDTIGRDVAVEVPGGRIVGRAVGLDPGGRLILDVDGDRTVVAAGDVVHLRSR